MKKIVLIVPCLFIYLNLFSQYFVNPESRWNVEIYSYSIVFPIFSYISWEYKLDEPIIANDHTYYKLFHRQDSLQPEWTEDQFYYREENGIVYRSTDLVTDYITYNFNIDSVNQLVEVETPFSSIYYTVTEIDSVQLLNGEKRRRIKLLDEGIHEETVWIEGIGGSKKTWDPTLIFDGPEFTLQCYSLSEELLYQDTNFDDCYTFIVDNEDIQIDPSISVFPNPVSSHLWVEFGNRMTASFQFQLFDSQGKHILSQKLSSDKNQIILPSNIGVGLYYFIIQNEKRKVVQHGKLAKL